AKQTVTQTVRCKKNSKQILQNVPGKLRVHGVLGFSGEHSRIQIEDPINEMDIVLKNELRDYIQMIAQEEKAHSTSYIDSSKIIETLERFSINNPDRKSTRLNSSHVSISYAVFCLKKKKI